MDFDYFLSNKANSILYYGVANTLFVESDFLETEGINYGVEVRAVSNCIASGIYPIVEIVPTGRQTCTIEIYYKNELKRIKNFAVIDLPNPFLTAECLKDWNNEQSNTFDEIIGTHMKLNDFKVIKQVEATILIGVGGGGFRFEIQQFDFSVVRGNHIICSTINYGNSFGDIIEEFKNKLQVGDRILFENIKCRIAEFEGRKAIERVFNYNVIQLT